ncbi:hypothetical protein CPT_Moabite_079 [Serratia phage Moabite]|uniref:Uncharacterized protein n=1 Tax=Serratia phage Moabite TaxID=2587814 RepID=A0A4Y5TQ71_9CAUD|nr:hypothetical protein HWC48_gp337 [Serratia phage Moabite]QDB71109.1 hypothetical protein CPT_Moabite_079 [Serratia phage Moabite]
MTATNHSGLPPLLPENGRCLGYDITHYVNQPGCNRSGLKRIPEIHLPSIGCCGV